MKISRCMTTLFLLCAAATLPADAGIYYRATTTVDNPQGEDQRMVVEARVEGEKARIEFQDSNNPMMEQGSYLLTTDGGRTIFLVDPQDRTYAHWDMDAMMQLAGSVMEGMGGMLKMEVSEPQVEKILEEDGGPVAGLPTRHYRFRTTYAMQMKVFGMRRGNQVESVQDVWATDELDAVALGAWLRKEPPSSGNDQLDRLVEAEMSKIQGLPLKTVTVTTTTGEKKGRQSVTRNTTEVTELRRDQPAAPAATWTIPEGYREVQLVPAGQEGQESPFAGLLGKKDDA